MSISYSFYDSSKSLVFKIASYVYRGVVSLVIFLEKNEVKKASSLSNRFAFKGVRDDNDTLLRD